jgi:hypothetical protein
MTLEIYLNEIREQVLANIFSGIHKSKIYLQCAGNGGIARSVQRMVRGVRSIQGLVRRDRSLRGMGEGHEHTRNAMVGVSGSYREWWECQERTEDGVRFRRIQGMVKPEAYRRW